MCKTQTQKENGVRRERDLYVGNGEGKEIEICVQRNQKRRLNKRRRAN